MPRVNIWGKITAASKPPPPGHPLFVLTRLVQRINTVAYQRSGGRIGGKFDDAPALLLHHVGRKSGQARTSPLVYAQDGERVYIAGSYGGQEKHPAWFLNVRANPDVEIQIGRERRPVRARVLEGAERDEGWQRLLTVWPSFRTYQARADRQIPVVELTPR